MVPIEKEKRKERKGGGGEGGSYCKACRRCATEGRCMQRNASTVYVNFY